MKAPAKSEVDSNRNDSVWFQLPVKKLERAVAFYEELLKDNTKIRMLKNKKVAILLDNNGKSYGSLYEESSFIPDMFGIIIYFGIFSDIKDKIQRIKELGGKVLLYNKEIEDSNFNALIQDSEGNRIAIYKTDKEFFDHLEQDEPDEKCSLLA